MIAIVGASRVTDVHQNVVHVLDVALLEPELHGNALTTINLERLHPASREEVTRFVHHIVRGWGAKGRCSEERECERDESV